MHELLKIKENIYIFTPGKNDRPIFGLIKGESNSIIIDAGNSPLHAELFLGSINSIKTNNTSVKKLLTKPLSTCLFLKSIRDVLDDM